MRSVKMKMALAAGVMLLAAACAPPPPAVPTETMTQARTEVEQMERDNLKLDAEKKALQKENEAKRAELDKIKAYEQQLKGGK